MPTYTYLIGIDGCFFILHGVQRETYSRHEMHSSITQSCLQYVCCLSIKLHERKTKGQRVKNLKGEVETI